jgi:hypothetical protein
MLTYIECGAPGNGRPRVGINEEMATPQSPVMTSKRLLPGTNLLTCFTPFFLLYYVRRYPPQSPVMPSKRSPLGHDGCQYLYFCTVVKQVN